ncbi:hypothetical protein H6P81_000762 [Aristolochia fimbriata]|uniref:DUF868 family protein n=1 Tax=Aristolochia fimbriata TaxID=158543 RepID=A0AAV7F5T6_ARIFI|nr:hypothetical protein H6P81_000762 [Aristolochia fimbriata]
MPDAVPSCFRAHGAEHGLPNLTTSFYSTPHGVAALTWARTLVGRSLRADLHLDGHRLITHNIHINPWLFWKKQGSKAFLLGDKLRVRFSWDLARAKFHSAPEPASGFVFAVDVDGDTTLIAGERRDRDCAGARAARLVLRQEHAFANKAYATKARFGGAVHDVCVDCNACEDDPRLSVFIDRKKVLQVKRLKWKFRGNERIEFEGVGVQVSWDVYNWLFDDSSYDNNKYAVFALRFEGDRGEEGEEKNWAERCEPGKVIPLCKPWEMEKNGKTKKSHKRLLKTSSSSSSSSVSSAGSSTVMEWNSSEDCELQSSGGFSLLIHAWRN